MDFNWLTEMLDSIGIKMGSTDQSSSSTDVRQIEREITRINDDIDKDERALSKVNVSRNTLGSLTGVAFLFIFFILHSFWGAVIVAALMGSLTESQEGKARELKNSIRRGKARLERKRVELADVRKALEQKETGYFENISEEKIEKDFVVEDVDKTKAVPKDVPKEDTGEDRYPGSTKEAIVAYVNLEKISEMLPELAEHDQSTSKLFQDVFDAAMKTAKLIHGDKDKENRGFIFYNQVETLEKWLRGVLDLEKKEVYDSLLKNVKEKAKLALPKLQEKINKEYFKFINPDIMDLESEMTVMSKEVYWKNKNKSMIKYKVIAFGFSKGCFVV